MDGQYIMYLYKKSAISRGKCPRTTEEVVLGHFSLRCQIFQLLQLCTDNQVFLSLKSNSKTRRDPSRGRVNLAEKS